MECAKEIMKYAGQGEQDDDCDCCFILGIGKCWLHRVYLLERLVRR